MTSGNGAFDKVYDVDAVVVGAGPGGSIAARELARRGAKVLCVDRRQEIGAPKRCAEGISKEGLDWVGVKPHPSWAAATIRGAVLYSPKGKKIIVDDPNSVGYVVERKVFEKHLAADAIRHGARFMVKTMIDGVTLENGRVTGVTGDFMGRPIKVNAKLTIGADGVDTLIGRKAGLRTLQKMKDYHTAAQYEMAGVQCDMERLHLYFGQKVAPYGYAWLFPKSGGLVNVGIGILTRSSKGVPGGRALDYLDRFIEAHPEMFRGASPVEINASGIPVSAGIKTPVKDGLMLVGDAAQQVNPIHGGGIAIAMLAGAIAGDVGARAISEGDVSAKRLQEYVDVFNRKQGDELARLYKLRMFLEQLHDKDFEDLAGIMTSNVVVDLTYARFSTFVKLLATKMPKMLPLVTKYLKSPGKEWDEEKVPA